jgi:uncharacterized membrane protein (UPF0127 family)
MKKTILLNGKILHLHIADGFFSRARGLLGRKLGADEGLLITPCMAVHTFAMGYPIDVVFLDRNHQVVKSVSSLQPWRTAGAAGAHAVLELSSGQATHYGMSPGVLLSGLGRGDRPGNLPAAGGADQQKNSV